MHVTAPTPCARPEKAASFALSGGLATPLLGTRFCHDRLLRAPSLRSSQNVAKYVGRNPRGAGHPALDWQERGREALGGAVMGRLTPRRL
jgi:hypothetical protein